MTDQDAILLGQIAGAAIQHGGVIPLYSEAIGGATDECRAHYRREAEAQVALCADVAVAVFRAVKARIAKETT